MIKKFGLIGRSLSHSFSKSYFTDKFIQLGLSHSYENLEFENEEELRLKFHNLLINYHGFNVTIPYKESIMPLLNELDPHAKKIGAVNCIKLKNGYSKGYNTDYLGFIEAVKSAITPMSQMVFILGSGGASKAIQYCFKEYFKISFVVVSRNSSDTSYEYFKKMELSDYSIIVNTTPLGMFPCETTYPDIDYEKINESHICIDLVYNPAETIFLKKSKLKGALTINGHEMLINQAEFSWKIWYE